MELLNLVCANSVKYKIAKLSVLLNLVSIISNLTTHTLYFALSNIVVYAFVLCTHALHIN